MIDAAQIILDITAIGISIYVLDRIHRCITLLSAAQTGINLLTGGHQHLTTELKRIEELIPKEVIMPGIEPGVYLPKDSKNSDDPVEMVKAMDLEQWKELVTKAT